jgi:hypothetical protein
MNPNPAAGGARSHAAIMSELAAVLRRADESTTSIESAIAQTNVSMQEIHANFGGARELILAMVAELSDSMSAPLSMDSKEADLRERLLEFGQRVTDVYATSHLRGLYRIAITESIRHTGLGRDFYDAGLGRLTQRLAKFLRIAQAQGAFRCADADLLASHLLALLRATLDVADEFPHELASSSIVRQEYVRNAIDLFRRGILAGRQSC